MTIRRRWGVGILLAAAAAGLVGCSDDSPPTPPNPASPGASAPAAPGGNDSEAQLRRAGRASAVPLGDLNRPKTAQEVGAPFDPCGLAWTDFPEAVRPTRNPPPAPRQARPGPEDKWTIGCNYDNSGAITVTVPNDPKQPSSSTPGAYFIVSVYWKSDGVADATKNPNAQKRTWGTHEGFVVDTPDDGKTGPGCVAAVRLSKGGNPAGSGLVSVTNNRFPLKPCDIADKVAAAIAAKNTN